MADVEDFDQLLALAAKFGDHKRMIVPGMKLERADPREIQGRQALFVNLQQPRKLVPNGARAG